MGPETTLRHIEAFLKQVMEGDDAPGILRKALEAALAAIMEGEASELTGAEHGERSEDRATHRNGYRERRFDTGLGSTRGSGRRCSGSRAFATGATCRAS